MITLLTGVLLLAPEPAAADSDAPGAEQPVASPEPAVERPAAPAPTRPGAPAVVELPPDGAPPAVGGRDMTPLPPPPPAKGARTLASGPWRGHWWFGGRVEVIGPIAGSRPARGEVVSGGGAIELGWRLKNFLALRFGLSLAVHDAQRGEVEDALGQRYTTVDYGQIMGMELIGLRGYLPVDGRFQPYLDVTGGLGLWFPAGSTDTEVGGLFRGALGFDGWVSTNFTLGMEAAYRVYALPDSTGHFLSLGGHLGVHW